MDRAPVKKIHLLFKTHLDIGYTDYVRNVMREYFENFFPNAIRTAQRLRDDGRDERFIWTTGSWLIYEYLEQVKGRRRREAEEAIRRGDIVWHALPFTTHTETMDAAMFRFGLSYSRELDRRFGKKTFAGKMTDAPGHTRAIIPLLAEAGVRFVHIGVNGASKMPRVPELFRWRHPGGAEVIMMYHNGSYGGLTIHPGMDEGLAFSHTLDNRGPQAPNKVLDAFRIFREQFPGTRIIGSTLDDYARRVIEIEDTLPVVTEEIADTWIHGITCDPNKISRYRELERLRGEWLASGRARESDRAIRNFSRHLILVPEHTWGMDAKVWLANHTHFDQPALRALRRKPHVKKFEASWAEQRVFIDNALAALGGSALAREARTRMRAIEPKRPRTRGYGSPLRDATVRAKHFTVDLDPKTGALIGLKELAGGRAWAGQDHALGRFHFEVFSKADYDRFLKQYMINWEQCETWAKHAFGRPGIEKDASEHQAWEPEKVVIRHRRAADGDYLLAELTMPKDPARRLGCPRALTLEVELPDERPEVLLTLQWFDKPACRLPEAAWLSFRPRAPRPEGWRMDKMGDPISPLDVVEDGNRKLHGITRGVSYSDERGALRIDSLDAPLVAPGEPSLLDFNNRQPRMERGMHFNLYNNVSGTNFPMWSEGDARFRFRLSCE